jgi:hypothetical protein
MAGGLAPRAYLGGIDGVLHLRFIFAKKNIMVIWNEG